jgi:hypothetical protein
MIFFLALPIHFLYFHQLTTTGRNPLIADFDFISVRERVINAQSLLEI